MFPIGINASITLICASIDSLSLSVIVTVALPSDIPVTTTVLSLNEALAMESSLETIAEPNINRAIRTHGR